MLWARGVASCFLRGRGKADVVIDHSGQSCALKSGLRWQPSHPFGFLGAPWWGYMCWEVTCRALLPQELSKISLKHQCSGLCPQCSGAEQLASRQHWLALFSQADKQNWLSSRVRWRQVPHCHWKVGKRPFPCLLGEINTHVVREQCQQWQYVSWERSREGKAQVAKLEVKDSLKNHCLSMPESTKKAIKIQMMPSLA